MMIVVLCDKVRPVDESHRPTQSGMYRASYEVGLGQALETLDEWCASAAQLIDDAFHRARVVIGVFGRAIVRVGATQRRRAAEIFVEARRIEWFEIGKMADMLFRRPGRVFGPSTELRVRRTGREIERARR